MSSIENELTKLKSKFRVLFDTIPSVAWFTDDKGVYKDVNKSFVEFSGFNIKYIIGKNHSDIWRNDISKHCFKNDLIVLNTGENYVCKESLLGRTGYKYFNVYRTPIVDSHNNIIGIVAVGVDITENENNEAKVKVLIENIPFMLWFRDKNGYYINANSEFLNHHNITISNLIGKNIRDLLSPEDVEASIKEDIKVLKYKKTLKFDIEDTSNNKKKYYDLYKTPVYDIEKNLLGIVGTIVETTEIIEARMEMKRQAYTDYNTGLKNRRALYEFMDINLKERYILIFLMDIDNFKYINDTYGHYTGDLTLVSFSKVLVSLYGYENVYRLAGDEFVVVFENVFDNNIIKKQAQELLNEVAKISIDNMKNEKISVSIGISSCTCDLIKNKFCDLNREKLCDFSYDCKKNKCNSSDCKIIRRADIALYVSKQKGKNQYEFYSEGLDTERNLEISIERDLNLALDKDELKLHYQPQYTNDNILIGFEALFRWENMMYANVPIIKIISIMEKSNLIIKIGVYIIKKACIFAKKINKGRKKPIIVSFNVSSIQVVNKVFVSDFNEIIKETGVDPKYIGIELTETVLLDNISDNIQKLYEIKALGVKIILDDFGTGYSSLNYLVKMPLSIIKIDKSFINDLTKGNEYKSIIKLIIDCAHSLNLDIIAEGVETKEQLDILKDMKVNIIQGFLFSPAVEEKVAISLINKI